MHTLQVDFFLSLPRKEARGVPILCEGSVAVPNATRPTYLCETYVNGPNLPVSSFCAGNFSVRLLRAMR